MEEYKMDEDKNGKGSIFGICAPALPTRRVSLGVCVCVCVCVCVLSFTLRVKQLCDPHTDFALIPISQKAHQLGRCRC